MVYAEPDFYGKFKCTADKCRHSCCIGWEIDIDDDTAEYYKSLEGQIGRELSENVSNEPQAHFILTGEERCPFLDKKGLCRLILTLGEDSLCDICAEHPRFYNEFPERSERGLGLCCEEVVRLLLESNEPLRIIYSSDKDGEREKPETIIWRERIFEILENREMPLTRRMSEACEYMGVSPLRFDTEKWRSFFLGLERMDRAWTEILEADLTGEAPEGIAFERLAVYFVYRHFSAAENRKDAGLMLKFSFLSVWMIAALKGELSEKIRLYSAEIEYSDENIALIAEEIERSETAGSGFDI